MLKEKIAILRSQWPAHSVSPTMVQLLDELEDELEQELQKANDATNDASLKSKGGE
jgi:hypothetical protein